MRVLGVSLIRTRIPFLLVLRLRVLLLLLPPLLQILLKQKGIRNETKKRRDEDHMRGGSVS